MTSPLEILLVDDEPSHRVIAKRALLRAFPLAHVRECASLGDTLRDLAENKIALSVAVVDLNLQGQSGLEVVKALRADVRYRALPIVINSTSQLELDIHNAYSASISAYIFKSEQPQQFGAELCAAVRFLLR